MLPNLALQYALPANPADNLEPSNLAIVGHHYFSSNGTPTFDLTQLHPLIDTPVGETGNNFGILAGKIAQNSSAPADAPKGENGVGDGSVPWLLLDATYGTTGDVTAVYRINTAGGKAPKTCQSSPAAFSVQYASEYWFYSKPQSDDSSSSP